MHSSLVDMVNRDLSVSSNKGILMRVQDGVMHSFPVSGEPEWIAINVDDDIFFFEELRAPQIVKDLLGNYIH